MSNKLRQAKNLTNWFGVDAIFFETESPFDAMSNSKFAEYGQKKGALLACLYEMYHLMGYKSDTRFADTREMAKVGSTKGLLALHESQAALNDPKIKKMVRKNITSIMEGANMSNEAAQKELLKEMFSMALDKLLVEDAYKTGDRAALNSSRGRMVVDAYATLKKKLVDLCV